MTQRVDRVGEHIEGIARNRRDLVSPEGVPLSIQAAGHGERLAAFAIDMALVAGTILALHAIAFTLFFTGTGVSVGLTLALFLAFLVRTMYFTHFELAWQGRTPGKKACNLRVINRYGGELKPSAVIARNLTREVEIFLPLSLLFSLGSSTAIWQDLSLLGWVLALAALPLCNSDHMRAGDLVGGTQVIAMPKRALLGDLSIASPVRPSRVYAFTHEQLAVYGAFELQVLEEFLRQPDSPSSRKQLEDVCLRICRKICWPETVPPEEVRMFLTDFYAAERADLERGQLFGKHKKDKTDTASKG